MIKDTDFVWLNSDSYDFLRANEGYLRNDETVASRVQDIANRAFKQIYPNKEYHSKFIEYMKKGFISLSTPVWANFGRKGTLSISCFGSLSTDSLDRIMFTSAETGMMSKYGGGTSTKLQLRHRGAPISKGGYSDGAVHFAKLYDTVVDTCKQSSVRRGAMAVYLDIDHPDIKEFLHIKHEGSDIQNLFSGVCVTNDWLSEMEAGDEEKREIWAEVLKSRQRVGIPYIFYTDNANDTKPQIYKDADLQIHASNLCSEVMLSATDDESFVCCLSSLNAEKFDEWKDTDVVKVMTAFLDTVITDFIKTASEIPFMERTVKFARSQRSLGIGLLGYHSYLQSKMIPFESLEAKLINAKIFKKLRADSYEESIRLGEELGYAPLFNTVETSDIKRRNVTTIAVAPTSSSAFILGQTSQGIEPLRSNYYVRTMAKKKIVYKNPYLEKLLEEKGKNTDEVWDIISNNFGSVQKLNFLKEEEKLVFRTFAEISQMEVIIQASQRQSFIDQGQSINILVHPKTPIKEVNALMMYAYKNGIKSLYYQHSISAVQEFTNNFSNCTSCEA